MANFNSIVPKHQTFIDELPKPVADDSRQRRLMLGSLVLLLLTLGAVVWHDRDFWFPDSSEDDSAQIAESSHASKAATVATAKATKAAPAAKPRHKAPLKAAKETAKSSPTSSAASTTPTPQPPVAATTARTVLPPLDVEVIAGDSHRVIHTGTNSVRVNLEPGTSPQRVADEGVVKDIETAASVTTNASERVRIFGSTSAIVTNPVKPAYPLLARQMKVQGSVILNALISKEGVIQDLRVVSGPTILASAAQDAVRQWRFKPHFEGNEPVETQAKITVNFTISTN
jgi:TonB family protein